MNDNLSDVKVGDTVWVGGGYAATPIPRKVVRITPTQIIIECRSATGQAYEDRYRIKNGDQVGASVWHRQWIRRDSPELRKQYESAFLLSRCKKFLKEAVIPSGKEEREAFIATLRPYQPKPEAIKHEEVKAV